MANFTTWSPVWADIGSEHPVSVASVFDGHRAQVAGPGPVVAIDSPAAAGPAGARGAQALVALARATQVPSPSAASVPSGRRTSTSARNPLPERRVTRERSVSVASSGIAVRSR